MPSEWSIAGALAQQFFTRGELVCPNCMWTGHECDLLVVHHSLRLIDVEIKISRADLKADVEKEKWWRRAYGWPAVGPPQRLDWPQKIWKHYYVFPAEIWKDDLLDVLPPRSGIIGYYERDGGFARVRPIRRVTCNRDAEPITAAQALQISRLVSVRYWNMRLRRGDDDGERDPSSAGLPDSDVQPGQGEHGRPDDGRGTQEDP